MIGKMWSKTNNCFVNVYNIDTVTKTATVYSPAIAGVQNGNGWSKVSLKNLIPEEFFNPNDKCFMSKTEKNKIKSRLTLTHATWTCTDGVAYCNCEKAIAHEREIMKSEE